MLLMSFYIVDFQVRNATAAFIINLSVADLMLCSVNLPLSVSNFLNRGWIHGDLLCELFPLLRYGNVAVSLLSVMVITINRFVMITHPKIYSMAFRPVTIGAMIVATWLISFGPLLPTWAGWWGKFGFDKKVGTCTIISVNGRSPKSALFVLAFVLPCIIIIICYVRIFWVVRGSRHKARSHGLSNNSGSQSTLQDPHVRPTPTVLHGYPTDPLAARRNPKRPRNGNENRDLRLLKMILVIFGAFLVCYLPMTIVKVLGKEEDMPVLNIFSYIAVYLTCCTNPIVYVVMSREYRRAYIDLFTCICHGGISGLGGELSDTSRSIGLSAR